MTETAEALLEQAREQGVSLVGPGGLLAGLTKTVLETALEAEITSTLATRGTARPRAGRCGTGPGPRWPNGLTDPLTASTRWFSSTPSFVLVRDGQVRNKPFYIVLGVTVNGERDILGIWAGDGGEGAKYWLGVLTEIKNRGVEDVCIAVCDGLKGLPRPSPRSGNRQPSKHA